MVTDTGGLLRHPGFKGLIKASMRFSNCFPFASTGRWVYCSVSPVGWPILSRSLKGIRSAIGETSRLRSSFNKM